MQSKTIRRFVLLLITIFAVVLTSPQGHTHKIKSPLGFSGGELTNPVLAPDGTQSLPAYSFASDPDSGFFLSSAGNLRLSLAGSTVGIWDVTNWSGTVSRTFLLRHVNSSAGAPTYSFIADSNTGMYSDTADTLQFATGGVKRLQLDTETTIVSIAADGTGKAVCIKADTTLGTCTDAVGAGGTCTCS